MDDRLGIYEKAMPASLEWLERLTAARDAGFTFMEMSIDETDVRLSRLDMSRDDRQSLIRKMYKADFPIESICLSGNRRFPLGSSDPEIRSRGITILKKAIILAHDLGIRLIQIAGYDVYYEPSTAQTMQWFEENLLSCVEFASCWGVTLAFETMETPFLNTVQKCMQYVKKASSPWLQVYPDAGNITNAAYSECHDVLTDLQTGAGHIVAMHLKETVPGKFREVPLGTGHVDFLAIICKAQSMGVHRYVAELWCSDMGHWAEDIRFAHDFLYGKIKAAQEKI